MSTSADLVAPPPEIIRQLVPVYQSKHPIILIAQHWPCWLSTLLSLALPLERVFVQARFRPLFPKPTHLKINIGWDTLDKLSGLADTSTFCVLCSGLVSFLKELPAGLIQGSILFIHAVEATFARYSRQRDYDRQRRTWSRELKGMGLHCISLRHADFGGITNAVHLIASRGVDSSIFQAQGGLPRTLGHVINAAARGFFPSLEFPTPLMEPIERCPSLLRKEGLFDVFSPTQEITLGESDDVFPRTKL